MSKHAQPGSHIIPERHPSLPKGLTNDQLASWLDKSAVERFTDEQKRFFSKEELAEFEHESCAKDREVNKLDDIIKEVSSAMKKGNKEAYTLTIPATLGIKTLEVHRRENSDFVETGYAKEDVQIFGIPNFDTHNMEYFDVEGNEITERRRALSPKEKQEHLGFFKDHRTDENGTKFDSGTGEVFGESKMFVPKGFEPLPGKTGTEQ